MREDYQRCTENSIRRDIVAISIEINKITYELIDESVKIEGEEEKKTYKVMNR